MSEGFAELPGGFLLAFKHLAAVDHDIVVVADPIDPNGAKGECFKSNSVVSMRCRQRLPRTPMRLAAGCGRA